MRTAFLKLANAVSLTAILSQSAGITHAQKAVARLDDAAWARAYATVCDGQPCSRSASQLSAPDFKSDPHFLPLLRRALPQRQGWFVDGYGGTALVSNTVQNFLGIPRDVVLNENRYLTVTGCVPHVCTTTGMLWIDTAVRPTPVIFVGEDLIATAQGEGGYHLFLYTSRPMATYTDRHGVTLFPADFVANLDRWHKGSVSRYDDQHILLVTVVWPNARTHDYLYDDLFHQLEWAQPHRNGAQPLTQSGAKP